MESIDKKIRYYVMDIASYIIDTLGLTFEQQGIYVVIVHYYIMSNGKPIPFDLKDITQKLFYRNNQRKRCQQKIREVLDRTFEKTSYGYIHPRYLSLISKMNMKIIKRAGSFDDLLMK